MLRGLTDLLCVCQTYLKTQVCLFVLASKTPQNHNSEIVKLATCEIRPVQPRYKSLGQEPQLPSSPFVLVGRTSSCSVCVWFRWFFLHSAGRKPLRRNHCHFCFVTLSTSAVVWKKWHSFANWSSSHVNRNFLCVCTWSFGLLQRGRIFSLFDFANSIKVF